MSLHGKLKQDTLAKLYFDFLQRPHAVMFATDVAARGLDTHHYLDTKDIVQTYCLSRAII